MKIKVEHLFYAIVLLFLISIMNTCNSCQSKNSSSRVAKEIDTLTTEITSVHSEIINVKSKSITQIDLEIQGLKTEKRVLINTNQIFLTKKRPDERVLEIDSKIEKLEKEKENQ